MTQIYHLAKAYQEQLLRDAGAEQHLTPSKKKPVLMLINGTFAKFRQRVGSMPPSSSEEKHIALESATHPG